MTHDIAVLQEWMLVVIVIAALGSTAVPVLYFFTGWRKRLLGRLFMFQSLAFAMAMDLTLLFQFWKPTNILLIFWISVVVLTLIAASTIALAIMVWNLNWRNRKDSGSEARQQGV
jgi:hypothetical protein